jgi:membrane-bound metal-dependent hydrolase YbcI (DUF457 family)
VPFVAYPAAVAGGIGLFMFGKVAPDLDHPGSAITRSWGWLSRFFSWLVVRPTARTAYRLSATDRDRTKPVTHRGFTHTLPGGFVAAMVTGWTIQSGPIFSAVIMGLFIGGAARVYDRGWKVYAAIGGAALGYLAWAELVLAWPWLVAVMTIGCYAHAVDDCVTTHGAPLKWPLKNPETGKRWERYGTPEWMRFNTGSGMETAVVWAAMIAVTGLLYWLVVLPLFRQAVAVG